MSTTDVAGAPRPERALRAYLRFWPGFVVAAAGLAWLTVHLMGGESSKVDTFDCDDVGIVYTLARMSWAEGAVAYRDFRLDYGPAYFWYLGQFFRLAGLDSMIGAIGLSTVTACWFLAPLGIYLAAWRLMRRSLPAWGALLLHFSAFMTFLDIRLVAILYALLAIMTFKSRGPALHAVIGAAVGGAWLTGIQGGIFPGYVYVLTLLYLAGRAGPERMPWRQAVARAGGMAAGLALVLGAYVACYLAQGGEMEPLLYNWFVRTPINSAAHQLPFLYGADVKSRLYTFCRLTPLVCLAPVFFLLFTDRALKGRADFVTWTAAVLVLQIYALGRADIGHVCIGVALFAPMFAYMIWNRHHLRFRGDWRELLLLAGWLGLTAAEFAVFYRNEALGKLQPVVMLLAVLLVLAGERLGDAPAAAPAWWRAALPRWGLLAVALGPLAYLPTDRLVSFANVLRDVSRHPVAGARRLAQATTPVGPDMILGMRFRPDRFEAVHRLCDRINSDPAVRQNPYVYIFPNHCFLYNLLAAKNPTTQFLWGFMCSPHEDRQTVEALERHRPPYVVLHDILAPSSSSIVNLYLLRHYVHEHTYGEYHLYRRHEDGEPVRVCCPTSHAGNFAAAAECPAEVWRWCLRNVPGHPDRVLALPPAAGRFLWQRCEWPRGGLKTLRVRVEAAGDAGEAGTATVTAVRQGGGEELLAALSFVAGGARAREVEVPVGLSEDMKALAFHSDLPRGAYWKVEADCEPADPARAVNWSRMHHAFIKYTTAKEYDYANCIKTVPDRSGSVFVHPPHGFVLGVRRGVGVGSELLDGLTGLEVHCSPLPANVPSGVSLAHVILHRLDGRLEVLWQAPPSFPGPEGWDVAVKVDHPETIDRIEFASAYLSGTFWKIVGLYDGAR